MKLKQYIREKLQLLEHGLNVSGGSFQRFVEQKIPDGARNNVIVKIIKASAGPDGEVRLCAFDSQSEFCWDPAADKIILAYAEDDFGEKFETNVGSLMEDLEKIFNAKEEAQEQLIHIAVKDNEKRSWKASNILWEDRSNVVYLVYSENNVNLNAVTDAFDSCVESVRRLTGEYKLDAAALHRAVDAAENQETADEVRMLLNPNDNYKKDMAAGGDAKDQAGDAEGRDDDEIDADDIKKYQPDRKKDGDETLNGIRYAGAKDNDDLLDYLRAHRQHWEYSVALSPLGEEEFKRQMLAFPREVAEKFANKPLYYVHIDEGDAKDPTHNALRYFFIFNEVNDVTWKQVRKKRTGVLHTNMMPYDVIVKMLTRPGSSWKSLFYRESSLLLKNGHFDVVYADADGYVERKDGAVLPVVGGKIAASGENKDGGEAEGKLDKRAITVKLLKQRLKDELVKTGFEIDRRISQPPPPGKKRGKTLVPGRDFDPHNRQFVGPWHKFTDEDAEALANSFESWEYKGYDAKVSNTLMRVMDVTTLGVDAAVVAANKNAFKRVRDPFGDEQLENAQKEIDDRVQKSLKIAKVNLVVGDVNRTKGVPDDGKPYFNVKLPGNGNISFSGDKAKEFLQKFRIWPRIEAVYGDAAGKIDGLQLVVTMDNKLEK